MPALHDDALTVTTRMVRCLLAEQMPSLSRLRLRRVAARGTVNTVFRLGDDLGVRLPIRYEDPTRVAAWLAREAEASAELAKVCPVPTPRPVALGVPGAGYPLAWSVQTWVPGEIVDGSELADSDCFAEDLADVISALRRADTHGRRFAGGGGRGGVLRDHDPWVEVCLNRSEDLVDVPMLRALWAELRDLPPGGRDVMTHGDLVPGNVVVSDGRLSGVIDGGGFGPADPALELVAGWHLLDADRRRVLHQRLGSDELEQQRGRAWALVQALGLGWYYRTTLPELSRVGLNTLARIVDQPADSR